LALGVHIQQRADGTPLAANSSAFLKEPLVSMQLSELIELASCVANQYHQGWDLLVPKRGIEPIKSRLSRMI
jgi:hypothetical protein